MKRILTVMFAAYRYCHNSFLSSESAAQTSQECGTTPPAVYFQDGFASALNWRSLIIKGSDSWSIEYYDLNYYLYGQDLPSDSLTCKEMIVDVVIPADVYLHFLHIYDFHASLQADKRAILIGETSPGAIESISSFYLPDGSRVFIETVSFRLSNGEEFGNNGIQPDIPVAAGWDRYSTQCRPRARCCHQILE